MRRRLIAPAVALAMLAALVATASAGNGGVSPQPSPEPDASPAPDSKSMLGHRFPVRARHSYGDGFGAGRGHQGQDIFARCGKLIVAARGGRVEYRDYHGAAGHYIVIDGKRTTRDYMYAHLKRRARFGVGRRVRTGQGIGRVGDSGNASGCHLHFELWRGDWNGQPDVTRKLRRWDRKS